MFNRVPTESDLEYGKKHGFQKMEERENAKLAGVDPNASSTAQNEALVKGKTKRTAHQEKEKSKKQRTSDDEDSMSSKSGSDSSEGSYRESDGSDSDGSGSEGSEASREE